jgi:hypothetical protein
MLHVPHSVSDANASHLNVPVPVTGAYLDRNKLKKYQRAFLAVDLIDGKAVLVNPKPHQVACLCNVNTGYVYAARRVAHSPLRTDTESGRLPLQVASHHCRPSVAEQLLRLWAACSTDEQVRFCREAGVEAVFGIIELAIGVSDGSVS